MGTHQLTEEHLACLRGCSTFEQYCTMRTRFESGFCSFCEPDTKLNEVMYDKWGWVAWIVPKRFTTRGDELALQLVFFPKRHIRHLGDLTIREWFGFYKIIRWIYRTFEVPGGVFFARVGDMRYNVGTVPHLHFNLFVPNLHRDVWVPFCKADDGEAWATHEARMHAFARRYESGERA